VESKKVSLHYHLTAINLDMVDGVNLVDNSVIKLFLYLVKDLLLTNLTGQKKSTFVRCTT
jgi:hypothetical protein